MTQKDKDEKIIEFIHDNLNGVDIMRLLEKTLETIESHQVGFAAELSHPVQEVEYESANGSIVKYELRVSLVAINPEDFKEESK